MLCDINYVGAVYHYYDSHRRIFNDSRPDRIKIKEENDRKTKIRARQKQVHIQLCGVSFIYNMI